MDLIEGNFLSTNDSASNFYSELTNAFEGCVSFKINVAFVTYSGLQLLVDTLREAEKLSISGQVITSTYLNFTDPKSIRKLAEFSNIDLRIFVAQKEQGFHPKSYMFEYADHYRIYVGSSNLTQTALKSNVEWNVKTIAKKNAYVDLVFTEFQRLWERSDPATNKLLNQYQSFIASLKKSQKSHDVFITSKIIVPNSMQAEALNNLRRLRSFGENKALVIAATGSGKTYISAFDVKQLKPKRMLFVCHRESILVDAMQSFKKVLAISSAELGFLSGTRKELSKPYLFATNLSINNHLHEFKRNHFDYIVIDEAHHVSADTYMNLLDHFQPQFLLGMTATPERGDASSIYETFDNNIAIEVRLREALEDNLVVPFHYFGITEVAGIDYQKVDINKIEQVAALLKTNFRVEYILSQLEFYSYDGDKLKCIGFCANIDHAEFMADAFILAGINAIALTGADSEAKRRQAILDLGNDNKPLQVIFTVDIFNEGLDIPSINLILMLRPTASPIIFLQQLGRGLRKHADKSFLTVLDFIGNHNRSFLIAIALFGKQYFDKDSLKVAVKNNFISIPGCTHISLSEIAKEQILAQLETENFNSMLYLKEEYAAFKLVCGNRIPMLHDFMMIDGAPEPLKFIKKESTYIQFLAKVERTDNVINSLLSDIAFMHLYRFICDHIPAKRTPEFVILKMLLSQHSINSNEVATALAKRGYVYDFSSIEFAFEYLEGRFFDKSDNKKYINIGKVAKSTIHQLQEVTLKELPMNPAKTGIEIEFNASETFLNAVSNTINHRFLLDAINYALDRYDAEFAQQITGRDFLGLYRPYNMRDLAFVSEYRKMHSAFRGQGVLRNGNNLFLFIELHKLEDAIAYKDMFISQEQFQWDSPNASKPEVGLGYDIIHHQRKSLNLHLFVRKFRKVDGVTQPYVYIGKADYLSHEGSKPITMQLSLHNKVPWQLYLEFVENTDSTI